MLDGASTHVVRASAFSSQQQTHLPPVDTLHAALKCSTGASGTFDVSFGTTAGGSEYVVSCERGSVRVDMGKVTVTTVGGAEPVETVWEDNAGVRAEVKVWAQGLREGAALDARQRPEEALRDLDVVSSVPFRPSVRPVRLEGVRVAGGAWKQC